MEAIIAPVNLAILEKEITSLPADCLLIERGKFCVFLAKAKNIPNLLQEIGRLRELTFRVVEEGTGKALDLDEFDNYYHNLFIWDTEAKRVVGGYRVGIGKDIFDQHGIDGFYINSLFEIKDAAYPILHKSLELGRSYIVQEYQKAYLPLFLLWQGILIFLLKHPEYSYLIGPVSISKYYSEVSKSLIVDFVKAHFYDLEVAQYFQPRTPFQAPTKPIDIQHIGEELKDLERFMATIEPKHIKVPILLKQYTKLNAKFISFNLDPNFSDALDGLMLLDLSLLPKEILTLLHEK